jgi:hypothetical protein
VTGSLADMGESVSIGVLGGYMTEIEYAQGEFHVLGRTEQDLGSRCADAIAGRICR